MLKFEQQHKIDNNSTYVEFWRKNRVGKQIKGKSFYLLVGADVIVFVVLLLSFIEFNLSRVVNRGGYDDDDELRICLLYTSPSPRDGLLSRMPSSA